MIRSLSAKQAAKLHMVRDDPAAFHTYVLELRGGGVTNQAIADELGTSRQWVHKVMKKGQRMIWDKDYAEKVRGRSKK